MRNNLEPLFEEIRRGNCVAFVGAGFSAPAVPDWDSLLAGIADSKEVRSQTKRRIEKLLGHEKNSLRGVFDREAAAEILKEELGSEFGTALNQLIRSSNKPGSELVDRRRSLLYQIPFQSILTTNFDHVLEGRTGDPDAYREALRKSKDPWFNLFSWDTTEGKRISDVIKLHGDLDSSEENENPRIVLTRTDYRKLLFEDSRYSNFLRALLATRTVLFLGFSFSDAYLNLLRSEVLALLQHDPEKPLAYAVLDNVDETEADFLMDHEGIKALTYDSSGGDHSGFDAYLMDIHDNTAPTKVIGRLLSGKKILWLDPNPNNNKYGMTLINESTQTGCQVIQCHDPRTAVELLGQDNFHLVISHWGHGLSTNEGGEKRANAVTLLENIRTLKIEHQAPVIVFAAPDPEYAVYNRKIALSLGAFEYTWTFEDLFASIEKVFAN